MILTQEDYEIFFLPTTTYDVPDNLTLTEMSNININTSKPIVFDDAAYANDLCKI